MVEQKSPGQQPNILRGKTGRYNKTTREGTVEDPQAIQFFDLETGVRPKPFTPDLGGTPKPGDPAKPQRMPFMKIPGTTPSARASPAGRDSGGPRRPRPTKCVLVGLARPATVQESRTGDSDLRNPQS